MTTSKSTMRAVVVVPHQPAKIMDIGTDFADLQRLVGGHIEAAYPFEDAVAIICNEEGKLLRLMPNRALFDEQGRLVDILCGTFAIVGLSEDDFGPLDAALAQKYRQRFEQPEFFTKPLTDPMFGNESKKAS